MLRFRMSAHGPRTRSKLWTKNRMSTYGCLLDGHHITNIVPIPVQFDAFEMASCHHRCRTWSIQQQRNLTEIVTRTQTANFGRIFALHAQTRLVISDDLATCQSYSTQCIPRHVVAAQPHSPRQWCRNRRRPRPASRWSRHPRSWPAPANRPPSGVPTFPGSLCNNEHDKWTLLSTLADFQRSNRDLPRMETRDKNSSYILRLRIVEPIRMRRYESRSMPHSLTSVFARTDAARGVP